MDDRESVKADVRYSVEAIVTEEGLDGLMEAWNRVSANSDSPNVFTTYGWYRVWLRRLIVDEGRERLQPYVLAIRRDGAIVGIAPLVTRVVSRFGFRIRKLEFLTHHSDYNDLVVGEDVRSLTHQVMKFLARDADDWDFVDLRELRDDRGRLAIMESATADAGLFYRLSSEPDGCPFMPINAPWSEFRKEKHLRFARYASVRIEKKADEGFRVRVIEQPHREKDLLERMIEVEAQKNVDGSFSGPFLVHFREVFRCLIDDFGPRGLIAVVVVEKGDQLVSWLLLFRSGSKLWDYQTAYHHEFGKFSPGTILISAAIDYGFEHGCDEFDFLRGMDWYKTRWTSEFHRNQRMIAWNRSWISRLGAFAYFDLRVGRR
jgi:CelD/BcsL family acetyltransferase involved in cellulose biosynthesis